LELTALQNYLPPPHHISVQGDETHGYTVHWSLVPGAVGYELSTYSGNVSDTAGWRNSNQDWTAMGTAAALQNHVLLSDPTGVVPGGIYTGDFRVSVTAIGPEVAMPARPPHQVSAIGWASSQKTALVHRVQP
jgi:hypothetical protein